MAAGREGTWRTKWKRWRDWDVHIGTFKIVTGIIQHRKYEGYPPKSQNVFIKICVFILTCLNFSHLQSTLHLMHYTYQEVFFPTAQNNFLTHWFWCPLVLSLFFVSPLPHWKTIPFENFSLSGKQTNKNKKCWGQDQVNRAGGALGHVFFWSKTDEHWAWCRQVYS